MPFEALAARIVMKHQRVPMRPKNLAATVTRLTVCVDAGQDADFDKPRPRYRSKRPPFYAAWATPMCRIKSVGSPG